MSYNAQMTLSNTFAAARMNFIIASTFVDSLARLGGQAQTLVKQAAFDLQLAPEHGVDPTVVSPGAIWPGQLINPAKTYRCES